MSSKKVYQIILLVVILTVDLALAKLFLSDADSTKFIVLSTTGKVLFLLSELLSYVISTFFKTKNNLLHLFSFLFVQILFLWLLNLFAQQIISMFITDRYREAAYYVPFYVLIPMSIGLIRILTKNNLFSSFVTELVAFFIPTRVAALEEDTLSEKHVAALIPTYMPNHMTVTLIQSLIAWHPTMTIVVIDDNTPVTVTTAGTLSQINWMTSHTNLHVIRSQTNTLKAGALNQGLAYLQTLPNRPDAVFTFDDDVIINQQTIPNMLHTLFSDQQIGAVCSQVRISNKNKNLITRLQAMEYHTFNITKISDTGFLKGPLVMQGMLTAFKMDVLEAVHGFTMGHLIEDYDITVRIKIHGWKVKISQNATAWTAVPETIPALWKQRARWTYGGLSVINQYWKSFSSVYQDVIGHGLFLVLFSFVILSVFYSNTYHPTGSNLAPYVFQSAIISFFFMFIYNFATNFDFPDRDKKDWLIKFTILPEFLYANMLSLVVISSYLYAIYTWITKQMFLFTSFFYRLGLSAFSKIGFSSSWGTR